MLSPTKGIYKVKIKISILTALQYYPIKIVMVKKINFRYATHRMKNKSVEYHKQISQLNI